MFRIVAPMAHEYGILALLRKHPVYLRMFDIAEYFERLLLDS